jgi:hypothetical protein
MKSSPCQKKHYERQQHRRQPDQEYIQVAMETSTYPMNW